MTATELHRARVILHRLATAPSFAAFEAAAMQLGMPAFRALPAAEWLRRLRWRVRMLVALSVTMPYRAGGVRFVAN